MRKAYPAIPRHWTSSFRGMQDDDYLKLLRRTMLGDSQPEKVVLLEIEPEKQKTRVDFACTESLLGIPPVSLTDITKCGRQLFYQREGREERRRVEHADQQGARRLAGRQAERRRAFGDDERREQQEEAEGTPAPV